MKFAVTIDGRQLEVHFDEAYGKRTLEVDGTAHRLSVLQLRGNRLRFTVDDRPIEAFVEGVGSDLTVDVGFGPIRLLAEEARFAEVRKIAGQAEIVRRISDLKAPMPGLVTRILVSEGEKVETGTPILVMEAMKMENELRAAGQGTVQKIKVAPREAVEVGQVLVTFQ
jgi:acetyl/propionyl-CoA carboxylase alpha subunit